MDSWIISMMLGASILLGSLALVAFLWGIRTGQFDDEEKMMNGPLFDGEDELNRAVDQERKKESLKKKNYTPE